MTQDRIVEAGTSVGVVVIGRNEGDRLKRCLRSLVNDCPVIVYVDSGSTDGSVEFAQGLGVEVVDLDMSSPFTMARGRNAGFDRLQQLLPEVDFVQFVDGDCEVQPGWIEGAQTALTADPLLASVCGHRTERFPEKSIYNHLTDMDWRGPVGFIAFCGGDVLVRAEAFRQCGGFCEQMIAGEDPEICVRLRQQGWKLRRLDIPMTRHDAAMTRFRQWWKRTVRTGHAYAEGVWLHRKSAERPWRRPLRSNFFWGLLLPVFVALSAPFTNGITTILLLLYPIWMERIANWRTETYAETRSAARLYAFFCMLGKFPCALGQVMFFWRLATRQTSHLIEYKQASDTAH